MNTTNTTNTTAEAAISKKEREKQLLMLSPSFRRMPLMISVWSQAKLVTCCLLLTVSLHSLLRMLLWLMKSLSFGLST